MTKFAGDAFEEIVDRNRITRSLKEKMQGMFGDCGCDKRKKFMNKVHKDVHNIFSSVVHSDTSVDDS